MYINRTEPRLRSEGNISRKSIRGKENTSNGDSFSDTMASILEIDVVEVSDSTEEQHKNKQHLPTRNSEQKNVDSAEGTGQKLGHVDIKV